MAKNFDYQGAKQEGYSDEEIHDFLLKSHPKFNVKEAMDEGYSLPEINQFLSTYKPKKSALQKAGRLGMQYGLGIAERALQPYELAAEGSPFLEKREELFDQISELGTKKRQGIITPEEENELQVLIEKSKSPEKTAQEVPASKGIIREAFEKSTGIDTTAEGVLEKAAHWASFLKDPKKLADLAKQGFKSKELIKAVLPTGGETARGLGAGIGLQMAEEGDFGPIGTMSAAVIGDLIGGGVSGVTKAAGEFVKGPKQYLAKSIAKLTPKEKLSTQKQLINDFRKAGIQADLGSITDSNVVKMIEARAAQSGLVGNDLKQFKEKLSEDIVKRYKQIADEIGDSRFASSYEAGQAMQETLKRVRDADLSEARDFYTLARQEAKKPDAVTIPRKLASSIDDLEKTLKPGSLKGAEQKSVLKYLEDLKTDIYDAEGNIKATRIEDLINNKIAINDIINYEIQGGQKQLLKGIAKELDKAILQYGKDNPKFARNYINANKKFSEHAKTFRNKRINQILMSQDSSSLMNKMNSVQGVRDLENALSKTAEGKKLFNDLKRYKLDDIILKNMTNGLTNQVKLGKFSNILDKGKNREIVKSLMPPNSFVRLNRLQKSTNKIMESLESFFNASKSGAVAIDAALVYKAFKDFVSLLHGNPWPIMKTGGGLIALRKASKLMSDPEFLKLVEEAILASNVKNTQKLIKVFERMEPSIRAAYSDQRSGDIK